MRALADYSPEELAATFASWGEKPSHAARLLKRFYDRHGTVDLGDVGLSKSLRDRIGRHIALMQSSIAARTRAADGTVKLLVRMADGSAVEAVLMPSHRPDRAAGCVSSQAGCAMGCRFCASTVGGLERNLSAGEIVEQFLHLRREASRHGRRLATLVFMGIGEPMHNLDNVIAAIGRIAAPGMGGLGGRQITVSTVGIVPGIDRLAGADLNVHLAVSLHAPDDATRAMLIPMNRGYGVSQIMAAARRFGERTGRIVTVEYCLLAGVNDSDEQARRLAALMDGFRAHVNLIPYNSSSEVDGFERPSEQRVARFVGILREHRVVAHQRRPRGDRAGAACGQLRAVAGLR
jgi:23S rRNA (adenine2503-C2)-methyltransferase